MTGCVQNPEKEKKTARFSEHKKNAFLVEAIDLKLITHPCRFKDKIISSTCKNVVLFLEIPVFAVITKVDKCALSEQELEGKKTEICEAIGIASDKVLMCSNYQPNQPLDTNKDISVLEFLTKVLIL